MPKPLASREGGCEHQFRSRRGVGVEISDHFAVQKSDDESPRGRAAVRLLEQKLKASRTFSLDSLNRFEYGRAGIERYWVRQDATWQNDSDRHGRAFLGRGGGLIYGVAVSTRARSRFLVARLAGAASDAVSAARKGPQDLQLRRRLTRKERGMPSATSIVTIRPDSGVPTPRMSLIAPAACRHD